MPRKVTRDVGLMQHEVDVYEAHEIGDYFDNFRDEIPAEPGQHMADAINQENARRMQAILEAFGFANLMTGKASVHLNPLEDAGFAENSAPWLAAHWLGAYNRMMGQRKKVEVGENINSAMGSLIREAKEMGRLEERMRWRCTLDPQTGKVREDLAVGKRKQEIAIPKATEARKIHAQDAKPDWHDDAVMKAQAIREKHETYSRWRIAGMIHAEFKVTQGRCDKVLRENGIK